MYFNSTNNSFDSGDTSNCIYTDWETYEENLPAVDCPSFKTVTTFNSNSTSHIEKTFKERDNEPIITNGKWRVNGNIIILTLMITVLSIRSFSGKK